MSVGKNSISRATKATTGAVKPQVQKFYDAVDVEEPKIKAENVKLEFVPTNLILPSYDEASVTCEANFQDVCASVKNYGILIPLLLRKVTIDGEVSYRVLSGHKRLFAAKFLKIESVPAEVIICDDRKAASIYSEIEKYDSQTAIKLTENRSDKSFKSNNSDMPNYLL